MENFTLIVLLKSNLSIPDFKFEKFTPGGEGSVNLFLPKDRISNSPRGFAFTHFKTEIKVVRAFKRINGRLFGGSVICCLVLSTVLNPE